MLIKKYFASRIAAIRFNTTEVLLDGNTEAGLELNAEKTKSTGYMTLLYKGSQLNI